MRDHRSVVAVVAMGDRCSEIGYRYLVIGVWQVVALSATVFVFAVVVFLGVGVGE